MLKNMGFKRKKFGRDETETKILSIFGIKFISD